MNDFNAPGSSKSWMNDGFKKYVIQYQLDNVVNLLDAKVERCRVYNSDKRDEVYNQITITYKQEDN
tara:strand:+ start:719 stop:916 length:198 start_codon:yes stop_codon:yes gene_type:complete